MCNVFWAGIAALCGAGVWAVSHNPDTIVTGGGSAQPALGEINAHVTRYNTLHRVHTNTQHKTHNTQHTSHNTQHTTYNIQHTTHKHTTHNIQHTTHNTQHTTYNTQHTNIQHTTHNTQHNTHHTSHDITHNTVSTQTYKHTPITNICQSGHWLLAGGRPALVWEDGGAGAGAGALIAASLRTPTSSSLSSSLQLVILASNLSWLYYHISELYCTYCLLSGANYDFFSDVNRSICDIYSIPVHSQEPFNLNITHINCFWLIFFSQTTCNSWPSTL